MSTVKKKLVLKKPSKSTKPVKVAKKVVKKNTKNSKSDTEEESDDEEIKDVPLQKREKELTVKTMDPHKHALKRPDLYIGSVRRLTTSNPIWVYDKNTHKIVKKVVTYADGILRLFVEAISNAIDNIWRSKEFHIPAKLIKIYIDRKTGFFTVWNDGNPVGLNKYYDEDKKIMTDLYAPEVMFGSLLSSTNYDDDEDNRRTSGRNGLGIKCLSPDTIIPLWNGDSKTANEVTNTDILIGDDGTPRKILEISEGYGRMYEITQAFGSKYQVNEDHILTLHMPDHKVIFWNNSCSCWSILWWDHDDNKIKSKKITASKPQITCDECKKTLSGNLGRHYSRMHPDKKVPIKKRDSPNKNTPDTEEVKLAFEEMQKFASTINDDNTFDISIEDYMNLPETAQNRLAGVRSKNINWVKKEVLLDPYIMGLWLGDGLSSGYGYVTDAKKDLEIINYLTDWGKSNDATFAQAKNNEYVYHIRSTKCHDEKTIRRNTAPLKKLLSPYGITGKKGSKFIPLDYIVNDRDTRLKVLAGLIDSDGTVSREGSRITIAQCLHHKKLVDGLVFMVRSLGFACHVHIKDTQWSHKGVLKDGKAYNVEISGTNVSDIPTLLPRKKCGNTVSRNTSRSTGYITVKEINNGDFIGFSIDKNQRFLINDFTITHNCSNVFSLQFELECYNPSVGVYTQKWSNNMFTKEKPVIVKKVKTGTKVGYTQVKWRPDYARFMFDNYDQYLSAKEAKESDQKLTAKQEKLIKDFTEFSKQNPNPNALDDDTISVLEKHVYDYAMIAARDGVSVEYNDKKVEVKSLEDYAELYRIEKSEFQNGDEEEDDKKVEILTIKTPDYHIAVIPSSHDFQQVSFVNGICTVEGGVHVDIWTEALFRPLVDKINGKTEKKEEKEKKEKKKAKDAGKKVVKTSINIDIKTIKKYMMIFVIASLDKPEFEQQNKRKLVGPKINATVKSSYISKLNKWEFVDKIKDSLLLKDLKELSKEGKKKGGIVEGLEKANFAGKAGHDCNLILCEGLSAKTYVVAGIEQGLLGKIGRNYNGIYSIRGKFLNVLNASNKTIANNREVKSIIKAVALDYGTDYTKEENLKKLRYRYIWLCTDSDCDGCFEYSTPINMPSGVSVAIGECDHLSNVLSWREENKENKEEDGIISSKIEKFMNKGLKECIELLFEDGRTIQCTPDHKICDEKGQWIEAINSLDSRFKMSGIYPILNYAENINNDWSLTAGSMNFNMTTKKEIDKTLAFFRVVGILLTDGHIGNKKLCEIYIGAKVDIESLLQDLSLFINKKITHFKCKMTLQNDEEVEVYRIRLRTTFVDDLVSLGFPTGARVFQDCFIPDCLLEDDCPLIIIREFLGGLFGGDGVAPCLTKYQMRVSRQVQYRFTALGFVQSKCPELIGNLTEMMNNIKLLLSKFNIRSIIRTPDKFRKNSQTIKLEIALDDYLLFADTIGFRHCIHKIMRMSCVQSYYRLYNLVRKQRRDMVKLGLEFRKEMSIPKTLIEAIQTYDESHLVVHQASYPVEGNLKKTNAGGNSKTFKNLCRSGFPSALEYLRQINGLNFFITEDDIKENTNRQGTAHYGVERHDDYIPTMNLKVVGITKLPSKKTVYDLTTSDPHHSFIAGGIVAHNSHITGLLLNFFNTLFPGLIQSGFLYFLRTPIIKISMRETNNFLFYSEAQNYIETNKIKSQHIRYIKGLGTSTEQDVIEDFGRYPVLLKYDNGAAKKINDVFHEKLTNVRKTWLTSFEPVAKTRTVPDYEVEELDVSDFLDTEMILFSIDDNNRSLPSVIDGLKEATRKVLHAAFKRKLHYKGKSLKVAQFAGYVSEKTGYHHGETNLLGTITNMAQRFVGSNNIPLLYNDGMFGSLSECGKDAANGRYIFTKLDMLTRLIYREEDDEFLENHEEDGQVIEKKYYLPIVPMILINGGDGIGTGWSCNVPWYNIEEIIEWIKVWINCKGNIKTIKGKITITETPELHPWIRNFRGKIYQEDDKIITEGLMEEVKENVYHITEIPVGCKHMSISKLGEMLDELDSEDKIKKVTNQSTSELTDFTVVADPDEFRPSLKNLKLIDTMSLNNMVLFDVNHKLRRFKDPDEIMEYFCPIRSKLYHTRKDGILSKWRKELKFINFRINFIRQVNNGDINLKDREEHELEIELIKKGYEKMPIKKKSKKDEKEDDVDEDDDDNDDNDDEDEKKKPLQSDFKYLKDIKAWSLNIKSALYKKLEKEVQKYQVKIEELEETEPDTLWINELDELLNTYKKWLEIESKRIQKKPKGNTKGKKKVIKK